MAPKTPAGSAAGNILRSVALRAVSYCPDVSEFGEVFASFEALRSRLPDDVVTQLLGVSEQVDAAANEAAAAEAALQAVMHVRCGHTHACALSLGLPRVPRWLPPPAPGRPRSLPAMHAAPSQARPAAAASLARMDPGVP